LNSQAQAKKWSLRALFSAGRCGVMGNYRRAIEQNRQCVMNKTRNTRLRSLDVRLDYALSSARLGGN
jgi:hypothetical protein